MLYGENNSDFAKLTELLKTTGFSDDAIDAGIRYMTAETDDASLLDGIADIKTKDILLGYQRRLLNELNEELFSKNEELLIRFIHFVFKVSGISGSTLIYVDGCNAKKYLDETRVKALKRYYGDEALAIDSAIRAYFYHEYWKRYGFLKADDPEVCIKAVEMLDKYGRGDSCYSAKTALCALALNYTPLPDSEGENSGSPVVKTSCDTLINIYQNAGQVSAEQYNMIAAAMSMAAPFSAEAKEIFKVMAEKNPVEIANVSHGMGLKVKRTTDVIESIPEMINADDVRYVAEGHVREKEERLAKMIGYNAKLVRTVLDSEPNLKVACMIQNVLAENDPDFDPVEYDLKSRVQRRASRVLEAYRLKGFEPIRNYLNGTGSYDEVYSIFSEYKSLNSLSGDRRVEFDYYGTFGADDFFKRILTISMIANNDKYSFSYDIFKNTGYKPLNIDRGAKIPEHEKQTMQFMLDAGAPFTDIISCMGLAADDEIDSYLDSTTDRVAAAAAQFADLLADCEPKKMSVRGRIIYARALKSDVKRFRKQLMELADDSSKVVRAEILGIFKANRELDDVVKEMLSAKKQAKRDMAVSVIEEMGAAGFAEELQKAFDCEKSDKLKMRLAALIGTKLEKTEKAEKVSSGDIIKKLMKGASKLDWLYSKPFGTVHNTDGTEADGDYIKAIMLSYASMKKFTRNFFASELAQSLDQEEFALFAQEVFRRWYDKGAETKTKWVLYFCATHGGSAMHSEFVRCISEWGDYAVFLRKARETYYTNPNNNKMLTMRTSVAGDAVRALAMSGSDEALLIVDNIARKFKGKSVRKSAVDAMACAADGLGITAEELADRLVPDLGFDENLCRVFNYGNRQFSVYIRPTLELEIYSGDKKIKSMPKPGASDDAEKAAAAYEQFKEMKKQMKTAVTTQKNRLEYVLMCDRKWTCDGWKKLFVKNTIMHCFAIGLVWGIYEDGKLGATFRYMEDGSFTTADGDEFELPEKADIGLVHPVELSEELKAQWTEQLSDYEIVQPFPQLERRVYTPDDSELEMKRLTRFEGFKADCLALTGKMTRMGWEKGQAEDAAYFYCFRREDVSSRSIAPDGSQLLKGYGTFLVHSGMSIASYENVEEKVTIEDIVFFKAGTNPNYWDKDGECYVKCSEVPKRYFSEIMLQLTPVFGKKTEE